jgi:hypothetical protein
VTTTHAIPGFIEAVDAEVARLDALVFSLMQGAAMATLAAMAAQAQRPNEASQRGFRHGLYQAGLRGGR